MIKRYEQEAGLDTVQHIVVDCEGTAAEFLAGLKEAGRTAISVLRTDQYGGLDSFTDIGAFVRFCQNSNLILAEEIHFSYANPIKNIEWGTPANELSLLCCCYHEEACEENQARVCDFFLSPVPINIS